MKHNLLKSLIISVILLTGVSNAWALDIYLDLGGIDWPKDNASIKLNPGRGSDVQGSLHHLPSGLSVYKFTVQQASETLSFKRINPNDQNDTWNEARIQYNASQNNLYKLTGWESVTNADYSISTVTPSNYIYFDNSITNWTSTNKYFVIGHDKPSAYSIAYTMYKIENTQLWYTHNLGNTWTDATYYSFFADNDPWSGNSWGISNIPTADAYTAPFTSHKNLNADKYYLCIPTNQSNNQPFNISEYSSYTDLNYTQTIKAQVKYGETNPAYQQVISPATITATTHYFGSDYKKVDQTGSLTINRGQTDPAKLTQTVTAAYTSTVTLSYTDLHDAYEFMDWWDDTNQKTISTSATCTYVATKAATIYARFKTKENYTHKIYLDARNWNEHQPRYAVYAYYGAQDGQFEWIDMTAACGTNWYYTCEVPAKYSHVIFCRMNPENNNNTFNDDSRWGQTKDLLLLLDLDVNNCFTPDKDPDMSINGKTYNGSWRTPPTFTVTLEATSYGSFQVTCNGETKTEGEIFENVAAGTQLTITNILPKTDGYDQTMVYSTGKYTEFDNYEVDNQGKRTYTYTVTSDVSIAEDFRTKEAHTIFVKVPKGNASAYWEDLRIIPMNGITQSKAGTTESVNEFAESMKEWQNIDEYILYYFTIPAGNHSFKLYPANNTTASNSFWYEILPKDGTKDINQNCWLIDNEQNNEKATGKWVSAKVSLEPCNIGTYGIIYNNVEYLNDATNETVIEMPYGSSIQIIDATPTSPHYIANPRYETSIVRKWYLTEFEKDQTIEVDDDYNFAPNLVTKESHRVYLRIPNNLRSDWNKNSNGEHFNCIYLRDYLSNWRTKDPSNENPNMQYGMVVKSNSHETFEAGEDELWYIDIPAGYHTFVFERKNDDKQGTGFSAQGETFFYGIPTDGENICYTVNHDNPTPDDLRLFEGTWGPLPTCTITLGYPDIGRFGIIVDGETIYASNQNKRDTYITVPYGTEVQLLKGEPGDAAYTNNLVKEINGQKDYIIFGENETAKTFTITSNVKFDDIFATKPNQTVFIAVPKKHANLGKWYTCSNADHKFGHDVYVWQTKFPYDYQQDGQDKQTMQKKVAKIETNDYTYYQYTLDEHVFYFNFQFKSKKDANGTWDNNEAHAGTITSWCPPISTKNCFYLDGEIEGTNHAGGYTGYWDDGPPCKVIMEFTNIGRYGFKDCFGNVHYRSPNSKETEFSVPWGSQVEVLEGEPGNDTFTGTVGMLSEDKKTVVERFHDGENKDNFVTITRNTTFDDLFATKEEHVVYLGIPNEGFDDWYINNSDKMFAWIKEPYNDLGLREIQPTFVIDDITYYQYTLPAGIFEFAFQRKTGNNIDDPICETRLFTFELPVTDYNCFILEGEGVRNHKDKNYLTYDGYWTKLPAKPENVGDYRVLYAEKELIKTHEEGETEDWETAFRTVYEHPSDIIPKGEASKTISLHITTTRERDGKTVHPMVILQQFQQMEGSNTYKWVNLQAHTVLPLKATGNMGMLPGRKKTFGDLPFYDDGIEAIKNDTTYEYRTDDKGNSYKGSGVWNFTVTQGVSQSGTGTTVTLNVGNTTRYRGKYYIRTEALTNGWNNYKENLMTYSDYADYNSGFSHYFCKWLLVGNNVKFTIANDHAQSISDPLYGDATDLWGKPIEKGKQMVERDQVLNEDANVRFAWYEMNNFVHRAYLGGSTHVQDRFLVVKGEDDKIFSHYVGEGLPAQGDSLPAGKNNGSDPRYGLYSDEEIFRDDANWIYHADIQILPGCTATVTARHFKQEQTFIKERTLVYGKNLEGMTNKYPIRLLYDFKINRLITGYIPNGDNTTNIEAFTTNLMLIRREEPNDEDSKVTQLVFNTKAMDNSNTRAYGVLELSKERLVNDGNYNDLKRRLYWISFPFDVQIADVFGSGIYAQHWIIQSYNGQKRAANGYYYETTESNWEYHFDPTTINEGDQEYEGVLKKGVGYVVALNLYNIWKDGLLDNTKDAICLYFPSKDLISANIVQNQDITIDVPYHKCTKPGREVADSHWNVIGVPAYKNAGVNFTEEIDLSTDLAYYYRWDKEHNAYTPMANFGEKNDEKFSTLHAYMVQYHGGLNWKGVVREGTQSLAARSNTDHQIEHNLRLELQKDGKELDRTFVKLQENEDDVTSGFDFNYDLSKIINAGTNIYTIVKTNDLTTNVSGNVLPLAEDMVIPVGVVIDQAGEYTFSMPDGTDGIIAELIDYQTNTRTNLLLDNYTVTLPAGTNNSRFALSLQPDKTVTSVDNIGNEATGDKVKKYLIDGKLYLQKDGVLYDAQGHAL